MLHRLLGVSAVSASLCLIGATAPGGPSSARKAAEEFQSAVVQLDEDFQKGMAPARADYTAALTEARKAALEKNDLEEAQRIAASIKGVEALTSPLRAVGLRHRLAGTTWEWEGDKTVTLNADGSVSASWMPKDTGRWYVNPDLTVVWWSTGQRWLRIMTFNANLTAHESRVPTENLPRAGKRVTK